MWLLVASMLINYAFVRILSKHPNNLNLSAAIILNLAVLGYFKYRFFIAENLSLFFDTSALTNSAADHVVPLAISFFTFQQIALLFDIKDQRTKVDSPLDYIAFVALFRHQAFFLSFCQRKLRGTAFSAFASSSKAFRFGGSAASQHSVFEALLKSSVSANPRKVATVIIVNHRCMRARSGSS